MRVAELSDKTLNALQPWKTTLDAIDPLTTTVIVSRSKSRDELNNIFIKQISSHDNPIHTYHAIDIDAQKGLLCPPHIKYTQTKKFQKLALPETLTIYKRARVMILCNSHVRQGWVNGTMCEVETCTDDVIFVRNLNTDERKPIFRVMQRIPIPGAKFHLCRQQFPMMFAFAITTHKIQGSTLLCIAILCIDKYFASSQMYVTISCMRKLDDLFLLEFDPKTFPSKVKLSEFFKQLLAWIDDHNELNPNATHSHPFPASNPNSSIDELALDETAHNADDLIDLCSDSDSNSDSETSLCQADGTDVHPTTHQTYNAMVADLIAAFDDLDTKHDNIHSGDSDTPVSDIDDTIIDASRDPADGPSFVDVLAASDDHGKNDSNVTSSDDVLNETDMSIEIAVTDNQYHDETHMLQTLIISLFLAAASYNDALTAWRRHVATPFPLIIQPDTIVRTPRSHEVRPTHVLGYDIDTIQGDGNCFFRAISKEIFATEVNHPTSNRQSLITST